jgi:hypothetical protein
MLWLFRFQCVGTQISTDLSCIDIHSWPYVYWGPTCTKFDLHQTFENLTTASAGEHTYCNSLTSAVFWTVTPYRELINILEDLVPLFSSWFCWNSVQCTRVTDITSPNTAFSLYTTVRTSDLPFAPSSVHSYESRAVILHVDHVTIKCNLVTGTDFWTGVKMIQVLWDDMVLDDNYWYFRGPFCLPL